MPLTAATPDPGGPAAGAARRWLWPGRLAIALVLATGAWLRLTTTVTDNPPDSFSYMGGALELLEHHRYALRAHPRCPVLPPDAPGHASCRMPGYSIALAAMVPWARSYASFEIPVRLWNALFDLVVAALIVVVGRRLLGAGAAWVVGGAFFIHPMVLRSSLAILTEPLATLLAMSTLALLIVRPARLSARQRYGLAGALLGASLVVRIDTLFFLPLLAIAAAFDDGPRRARAAHAALSLLVAGAVFSLWPARNLAVVGRANPLGGESCDMCGMAVPGFGAARWLATWMVREEEVDLHWSLVAGAPPPDIGRYPRAAFASPDERATVERLIARRRREGLSPGVSDGFLALARQRVAAHPLQTLVAVPIERAFYLLYERPTAITWSNYILRHLPLPLARLTPWLPLTSLLTLALALGGLVVGLAQRPQRRAIALLGAALVLRCGGIGLVGQVEQRYSHQVLPALLLLAAWFVVWALGQVRRALAPSTAARTEPQRPG